MNFQVDITEGIVFTKVGDFLTAILDPSVTVVQGQANRVPEVAGPNFVVMTAMLRPRLATNVDTWDASLNADQALSSLQSADVQTRLDIHGPMGADVAQIISTAFRSSYGCDFFAASGYALAPLYTDDPQQMPFINAENQYENRWILTLHLEADVIISTPQDFASTVTVTLVSVDAVYPPGA